MFSVLTKYAINGYFSFEKGQSLNEVSKEVPNLPGVYYIERTIGGISDIVYIGKSGTISQNGTFKGQGLNRRLNNKQGGKRRQDFFIEKCQDEKIDALIIYWYVTFKDENRDLPSFVEGKLVQRYYERFGVLPVWNKEY